LSLITLRTARTATKACPYQALRKKSKTKKKKKKKNLFTYSSACKLPHTNGAID
jgi:hypothetical protein